MVFHVSQVKYVHFCSVRFNILVLPMCMSVLAHHGLFLGVISALDYLVFIQLNFKKRNPTKWKKKVKIKKRVLRKIRKCITSSDTFIFLVTGILISLIDKILCFVKQKTHRFVYYLFCQTLTVISEMLFLSVKHLGRLHNKLIN